MSRRPPFDPARIRRPPPPPGPSGLPDLLSVRQAVELVGGAIRRHVPPTLHVLGEIGNLSRPSSGHVYFSLKDAFSELRCVLWRSTAARLKFNLEVGMEVIATGGIEVYTPRGTFQLMVSRIEPRGVGALELAFRQLKLRLEQEGLFDPARKRPLPRFPQRVALITSPTGAAIRDILHTLARRFPAVEVCVLPVRVQGEGAAAEIAEAIRTANRMAADLGGIDVIITGRGGGSLEDLWAFNEEVVARAIHASRIPVVSAVGHEVDVSISDLVADVRAPTPTAAAELITPDRSALRDQLRASAARLERAARHGVDRRRARLAAALAAEGLARPMNRVVQLAQHLDEGLHALKAMLVERFHRQRDRLNRAELALYRFARGARFNQAARDVDRGLIRLGHALRGSMLRAERELGRLEMRLEHAGPGPRLSGLAQHLRTNRTRVAVAGRNRVREMRRLLESRIQALTACAPRRVLERGYSITRDARTRRIVRSVREIRDRQRILTQLADGEFRATADDPKQLDLFES